MAKNKTTVYVLSYTPTNPHTIPIPVKQSLAMSAEKGLQCLLERLNTCNELAGTRAQPIRATLEIGTLTADYPFELERHVTAEDLRPYLLNPQRMQVDHPLVTGI